MKTKVVMGKDTAATHYSQKWDVQYFVVYTMTLFQSRLTQNYEVACFDSLHHSHRMPLSAAGVL